MKPSQEMWFGHIIEEFKNEDEVPKFSNLYEKLGDSFWSVDEEVYGFQDSWIFGLSNKERRCAFCSGTIATGSKFELVSHAIPEGLGNKRLLSHEECDSCNAKYSKYEQELIRSLSAERVFVGARGKDGPTDKDLSDSLHLESQGAGRPIRLNIDMQNGNPIVESDKKIMTLPVQNVSYRPISAIRSILRSAWLMLKDNARNERLILREYALGDKTPDKFEFLKVFSPGAPSSMGRLIIWGLKDTADTQKWPQTIVTLSLFSTTLIWRQPIDGKHVISPMPPFPSYHKNETPSIQRFTVDSDNAFNEPYNLDISYELKVEAPPDQKEDKNKKRKTNDTIAAMKATASVQIGIGTDYNAADFVWISADRMIRAIRGDFSGYSQIKFVSKPTGTKLWVKYQPETDSHKIEINFSARELNAQSALQGLTFLEKFAATTSGQKLFLKQGDEIVPLSLDGELGGSSLSPEQLALIRKNLQMIQDISTAVQSDIKIPDPITADQNQLLDILHAAIKGSGVVRVSIPTQDEFAIPNDVAEQLKNATKTMTLSLDIVYPYAGIKNLTLDIIGQIQLDFDVDKIEVLAADTDPNYTVVRLRSPRRVYQFNKFLKQSH